MPNLLTETVFDFVVDEVTMSDEHVGVEPGVEESLRAMIKEWGEVRECVGGRVTRQDGEQIATDVLLLHHLGTTLTHTQNPSPFSCRFTTRHFTE